MYHAVEYRYSLPFSDLFELKYLFESENTHMQNTERKNMWKHVVRVTEKSGDLQY